MIFDLGKCLYEVVNVLTHGREREEEERRELKGAEASIHNMPLISSFAAQKLITPTMGTLETLKTLGEVDNEGKIYVPQWRRRKKTKEEKKKNKKQ